MRCDDDMRCPRGRPLTLRVPLAPGPALALSGSTCDCVHLALAPPAPLAVRTAPGRPTCREGSGPVTRSQHGSTGHTYGIMSCTRPHMRHRMGRKLRPDARLLGWALGPRAHTQDTTHTHTHHIRTPPGALPCRLKYDQAPPPTATAASTAATRRAIGRPRASMLMRAVRVLQPTPAWPPSCSWCERWLNSRHPTNRHGVRRHGRRDRCNGVRRRRPCSRRRRRRRCHMSCEHRRHRRSGRRRRGNRRRLPRGSRRRRRRSGRRHGRGRSLPVRRRGRGHGRPSAAAAGAPCTRRE